MNKIYQAAIAATLALSSLVGCANLDKRPPLETDARFRIGYIAPSENPIYEPRDR